MKCCMAERGSSLGILAMLSVMILLPGCVSYSYHQSQTNEILLEFPGKDFHFLTPSREDQHNFKSFQNYKKSELYQKYDVSGSGGRIWRSPKINDTRGYVIMTVNMRRVPPEYRGNLNDLKSIKDALEATYKAYYSHPNMNYGGYDAVAQHKITNERFFPDLPDDEKGNLVLKLAHQEINGNTWIQYKRSSIASGLATWVYFKVGEDVGKKFDKTYIPYHNYYAIPLDDEDILDVKFVYFPGSLKEDMAWMDELIRLEKRIVSTFRLVDK